MRRLSLVALIALGCAALDAQGFQQGPPPTPAETLLERLVLRAIQDASSDAPTEAIKGVDANAEEIWITCYTGTAAASACPASRIAAGKLRWLIEDKGLERPARTIRFVALADADAALRMAQESQAIGRVLVAIHIGADPGINALQIVRTPWSRATIADEIVDVFARQAPYGSKPAAVDAQPFRHAGQPRFDAFGVPTLTLIGNGTSDASTHVALVSAAAAYFLATMPNAGSEALLSHLMVGAHARLADDARRVVAQMGMGQRPSGDVLNTIAHAIEREQRRIRSFARFVPSPIDQTLDARLMEMEKGITGAWTSLGMSSAPFTPASQRIRGRGGEDRRVPTRAAAIKGPLDPGDDWVIQKAGAAARQLTLLKTRNSSDVAFEIVNFIDGRRSISDIRDAVSAEFGSVPLTAVVEYLELLAKIGFVSIQ